MSGARVVKRHSTYEEQAALTEILNKVLVVKRPAKHDTTGRIIPGSAKVAYIKDWDDGRVTAEFNKRTFISQTGVELDGLNKNQVRLQRQKYFGTLTDRKKKVVDEPVLLPEHDPEKFTGCRDQAARELLLKQAEMLGEQSKSLSDLTRLLGEVASIVDRVHTDLYGTTPGAA